MKKISYLMILIVMMGTNMMWKNRGSDKEEIFSRERDSMVERQLRPRGITDPKVLEAMLRVKRHLFIPEFEQSHAYEDRPLLIGYGQTISQPYIVAYMTQSTRLQSGDRVLEIGTGSGYQAAILAEIVEAVYTIEIVKPLAEEAQQRLKALGYDNIFVKYGDGYEGWAQYAPFDVIIVTAAPVQVPMKLVEQLRIGGRMVIPVGGEIQNLYLITKTQDGIKKELLLPVRFVPMVQK